MSKMSGRYYNRMSINVGALIAEVHARPLLWDRSSNWYSDRNRRDAAWNEVCLALYPTWDSYEESLQWVIEQDLRKRWKTVRDRFLKWHRQLPDASSSPSRLRKVPHHDELLFILPQRALRRRSRNYESSQVDSPDEEEGQQLMMEREPKPSPSVAEAQEVVEEQEIKPDLQEWATASQMETDIPQHQPHHMLMMPQSPPMCHVLPAPTRTSSNRRSQRTLRTRDRLLGVESNTPSLRQGHDEWDWYGRGIAAACRQMRPEVRRNYVAFCIAIATDFASDNPPQLGDLINHVRRFTRTGPRPNERSRRLSTSTQTDPIGGWVGCI